MGVSKTRNATQIRSPDVAAKSRTANHSTDTESQDLLAEPAWCGERLKEITLAEDNDNSQPLSL